MSSLCTVAAAAAITIGAFASRRGVQSIWLWVGALAAPASLAFTGHAVAGRPAWLSMTAVAAHALAAGFWAGSLVALHLLLRRGGVAAAPALRRFSAIAMPAVAVLLAGGTVFAVMQLGSLRDLAETRYGNLVLVKAVLLVTLLLIAARNRFALLPRLGDAPFPLESQFASFVAVQARCDSRQLPIEPRSRFTDNLTPAPRSHVRHTSRTCASRTAVRLV